VLVIPKKIQLAGLPFFWCVGESYRIGFKYVTYSTEYDPTIEENILPLFTGTTYFEIVERPTCRYGVIHFNDEDLELISLMAIYE
jgi:hypothetical protein